MASSTNDIPGEWQPIVARFQFEIRLGWFWDAFYLWVLSGTIIGALLSWTLRSGETSILPGILSGLGLIMIGFFQAVGSVQQQGISLMDCLSRLDDGWSMNQHLIRAYAMKGPWPGVPSPRPAIPVQVQMSVWGTPLLIMLLCLGLAVWIPPVIRPPSLVTPKAPPPAWEGIEEMLQVLEDQEIVEPDSMDELQEALEDLQTSAQEEWFGQAGLEATDRLKDQVRSQTTELMDVMNQTANMLEQVAMQAQLPQPGAAPESLQREFLQMLEQMGTDGMQFSSEQLDALRNVDLKELGELSPEQLQALEEKLRQQCEAMGQCLVESGLLRSEEGMQLMSEGPNPGGGPDGGGHENLGLQDQSSLGWGQTPVLLEMNPEAAMEVGDQLEIRVIEHGEAVEFLERRAGKVSSEGEGGAAVWRQELVPEEQRVLQQFFDSRPASDGPTQPEPTNRQNP